MKSKEEKIQRALGTKFYCHECKRVRDTKVQCKDGTHHGRDICFKCVSTIMNSDWGEKMRSQRFNAAQLVQAAKAAAYTAGEMNKILYDAIKKRHKEIT